MNIDFGIDNGRWRYFSKTYGKGEWFERYEVDETRDDFKEFLTAKLFEYVSKTICKYSFKSLSRWTLYDIAVSRNFITESEQNKRNLHNHPEYESFNKQLKLEYTYKSVESIINYLKIYKNAVYFSSFGFRKLKTVRFKVKNSYGNDLQIQVILYYSKGLKVVYEFLRDTVMYDLDKTEFVPDHANIRTFIDASSSGEKAIRLKISKHFSQLKEVS